MSGEKAGIRLLIKMAPLPAIAARKIIGNFTMVAKSAGLASNDITLEIQNDAGVSNAGEEVCEVTGSAILIKAKIGSSSWENIKAAFDNTAAATALASLFARQNFDMSALGVVIAATNLEGGLDADADSNFKMLGGLQSKGVTFNAGEIEVTNHESNQWKAILDEAGVRSMELSAGGVETNRANFEQWRKMVMDQKIHEYKLIDVKAAKAFRGLFKVTSFEVTGDHDGALTYSASFSSSDQVVIEAVTGNDLDGAI